MKKIAVVLSMLVLAGSAFALNAVSSSEKECEKSRAAFQAYVETQGNNDAFIAQNILINMADPMAKLSNEAATPLAVCYNTYYVHGQKLVDFVRANATIFPGDISGKEAANMRMFAGQVEALSKKEAFDKMALQDNAYFIAQDILINMADGFAKLSDQDAAPVAKVYMTFTVKGEPMVNFVAKQAQKHDEFAELEEFANRVRELAK